MGLKFVKQLKFKNMCIEKLEISNMFTVNLGIKL